MCNSLQLSAVVEGGGLPATYMRRDEQAKIIAQHEKIIHVAGMHGTYYVLHRYINIIL